MTSISTKTGDKGETGLADGTRLPKSNLIFEVIGDLDELNSWLGLVISKLSEKKEYKPQIILLNKMQEVIFAISAEIARAKKFHQQIKVNQSFLNELEELSSSLQKQLAKGWHHKFLYPGGTEAAARTDVARTVCRRVERSLVKLAQERKIRPVIMAIINRFSDYLYLLRCYLNQREKYSEIQFELEEK